jgi:hypothetical protein
MTSMTATAAQIHSMSPRRRARLARTLFVISALALMLAGMVFNQSAVATDETVISSNAFNYVSVMPGDTLWGLAETYSDGKSQQDWIAEVILLNNLSSATLSTGDKLALP